ncbi:hypothetical protein [Mycoplasma sp. 1232]|uniref:hypothetical protein n=1 Tax=Mycoplasma sp. 1232 TaxID=3108527 RepID=UPI002B263080|nr:hypothetical protein [Mycoplasma sp. 1232]MEA4333587.1 hypothetical protein [Mycoplasma sp. 1232]
MLSIIKELKPKLAKLNIAILVISIFVLISGFSYFVFLTALTNYKKSTTSSNVVISLLDLSALMSQWWLVTLIFIFGILNVICIVFMLDIRKSIFALIANGKLDSKYASLFRKHMILQIIGFLCAIILPIITSELLKKELITLDRVVQKLDSPTEVSLIK